MTSKVVGFYRDKKDRVRPITKGKGKGGYRGQTRESSWKASSISDVKRLHAQRSSHARRIDESLRAPVVSPEEWSKQPNRSDVKGVDYPKGPVVTKAQRKRAKEVKADFDKKEKKAIEEYRSHIHTGEKKEWTYYVLWRNNEGKVGMSTTKASSKTEAYENAKKWPLFEEVIDAQHESEYHGFMKPPKHKKKILYQSDTYTYHTVGMGAGMYAREDAVRWKNKNAPNAVVLPVYDKDNLYTGKIQGYVVVPESQVKNVKIENQYVPKPSEINEDIWLNNQGFIPSYSGLHKPEGYEKRNQKIVDQYKRVTGRTPSSRTLMNIRYKQKEPKVAKVAGAVSYNKATGWMRISFPDKPPVEVRTEMKSHGFRYKPRSKTWSAKWTPERQKYSEALVGPMTEVDIKPNWQRKAEVAEHQAAKHQKESDERYRQFRRELKTIPFGQPILVGHHSEKSHRAHLKRLDKQMEISIREQNVAEKYEDRAKRYRRKARGESPGLIYRRIQKLEAEKRKAERWRAEGYDKERYTQIIERLDEQLKIQNAAYAESGGIAMDKIKLAKGDLIKTQLGPARVVRVNPKTVTVTMSSQGVEGWKLKLDKSKIYGKIG